ncbi:MAG TPA: triose-phosphate isomerase [Thermoanaerobaculia bacterium]
MSHERRRPVVAANWKMHFVTKEALEVARTLRRKVGSTAARVVLFPSFPLLPAVVRELVESELEVGAQDLSSEDQGAHTGEVSGRQLKDCGCTWALCGHSERRRDHHEHDALVAHKVAAACRHSLQPLLCVGETREERAQGRTFEVLGRQLTAALAVGPETFSLAYEPVWAIGTGETASPETAQEAHAFLRRTLAQALQERPIPGLAAAALPILYGGSVTPENAASLLAQPDVDGFLVGGASLDPEKFLAIIRVCD